MRLPSPFLPEPPFSHAQPAATAVLLCNLGTPEAPTPAAVRRYLREFLSDRRVVEIPRVLWLPILHGLILRLRPAQSAAKYASIWTPSGSPLRVWSERQAQLLQAAFQASGRNITVMAAMRYGQSSIASRLTALKTAGVTRVLVLPAYPQYCAATSASVFDAVYQWAARTRHLPELRFVNRYHDQPAYIEALAARIGNDWQQRTQPEVLVMSFHGMPERSLQLGDPYHCECQKTARLLAERLGLRAGQYRVTFQSRFGRARWLQPYTEATVKALAASGVKRLDLVCPGFIADCLETLEEIGIEGREAFLTAGGQDFHYIGCLNDSPGGIAALQLVAEQHLQGWPDSQTHHASHLQPRLQRALALGASQ